MRKMLMAEFTPLMIALSSVIIGTIAMFVNKIPSTFNAF